MTDAERREAARQFYYKWKDKGREDEEDRPYWVHFTGRGCRKTNWDLQGR